HAAVELRRRPRRRLPQPRPDRQRLPASSDASSHQSPPGTEPPEPKSHLGRPYNAGVGHASAAPPRPLRLAVLTAAALVAALGAAHPGASSQSPGTTAQSTAPAPAPRTATRPSACHITTAERTVAVGDVHGGYDQLVAILRAAGIIDAENRWSA